MFYFSKLVSSVNAVKLYLYYMKRAKLECLFLKSFSRKNGSTNDSGPAVVDSTETY